MNALGAGLQQKQITWTALPKKLHILIIVLTAIAVAILCWSGWDFTHPIRNSGWIALAVFALFTMPFTLFLPIAESSVFIGDTYLMAIAVMYGPSTCVVATTGIALITLTSRRFSTLPFVFNFSSMVCGAFFYSTVYQLAKPKFCKDRLNRVVGS